MLEKNQMVELHITGLTNEGNGVGRTEDGMTVFLPETAVGDQVKARIVKVSRNFAYGIVDEVVIPSPDRIEVDCGIFRPCGGCCFRHLSYESELRAKEGFVGENLRRIGGLDLEQISFHPIEASPMINGYRNKAQYPVRLENGRLQIGFYARRSHRVVDCRHCHLHPPFFNTIVECIKAFVEDNKISIYDEVTHRGWLRHLYIRYGEKTGEVMVCLVVNGGKEDLTHKAQELLIAQLKQACSGIVSVMLNINCKKGNTVLGRESITLYGRSYISDILCGLDFKISPLSFYQVNRSGAEKLYGIAAQMAELTGDEVLLDLYCGTGTIGLSIAGQVKQVVGVEIVPQAVMDAKENMERNHIRNAEFYCGDADAASVLMASRGIRPDVVILDPPRKGCTPEVLQAVAGMEPDRVVMVSCDSATLARDLAVLVRLGYEVKQVQPVDMFPRTAHVETCVLLSRRDINTIKVKMEVKPEDKINMKPTYSRIKNYIMETYNMKVHTANIAQVKRELGIGTRKKPIVEIQRN